MWKSFKAFALKGNIMDLAIGVMIGTAFGKIVTSLVNDIIMPPVGALTGGVDVASLAIVLKKATVTVPAVSINYGRFIMTVVDFLIIAGCIFFVLQMVKKFKKQEAAAAPVKTPEDIQLLREIRDALTHRDAK